VVPAGRLIPPIVVLCFLVTVLPGVSQEQNAPGSASSSYLPLYEEVRAAEQALADRILGEGEPLSASEVEELEKLNQEARLSLYGDLIDRSALLLVLAQDQLAQELLRQSRVDRASEILQSRELEQKAAASRVRRTIGLWSSLGTAAASFTAAFALWYLSEWQDEQYLEAETVDEAMRHRTNFKLLSWASYLAAGVGVLSAGLSIPVLAGRGP
jgi:hypothetical protein